MKLENLKGGGRTSTQSVDSAMSYVWWTNDAEAAFRNLFASPELWQGLHTDRFWNLTRDPIMQVGWELIFQTETPAIAAEVINPARSECPE